MPFPSNSSPSDFRPEAVTEPDLGRKSGAPEEPPLVLVVEDDEDTRNMYLESLAHFGYRTVGEHDGAGGVEVALALRPAAILMDIAMPGMSGLDATRRIKADPRTRACFVIVVTAFGMMMFDEARAAGSDAFLCKPLNPIALGHILRTISSPAEQVPAAIVKRCGCGRDFALHEWLALPLCGRMYLPQRETVAELRNCTCGSSLALEIQRS